MKKAEFREVAESKRSELRQRGSYGSSSDLYVSERANVAVIGIQTSEGGQGHDTIVVVRENNGKVIVETVLDEHFSKGRMWPTGISKNGKKFSYTIKDNYGDRSDYDEEIDNLEPGAE